MRVLALTGVVCVSLLVGSVASSQRTNGASVVSGQVVDPSGNPVSAATVKLSRPDFRTRTTSTDTKGQFRFENVPAATYTVEISHRGFTTLARSVLVSAEKLAPLTLTLTPVAPPEAAGGRESAAQATASQSSAAPVEAPAPGSAGKVAGGIPGGTIGGVVGGLPEAPPPPPAPSAHEASRRVSGDFRHRYPFPYPPYRGSGESYDRIDDNAFRSTAIDPLSTFSIDVDTASYANVRRFLNEGALPPLDAVRIEEMINYFRFDYPQPAAAAPFSVTTEIAAAPWNPRHKLALIGLQARRLDSERALRRNLVFLIDVSGSMTPQDKLPLIRKSMRMLVDTLTAQDRIAIVVYAGASGLVLPTTPGDHKERIHHAIARLEAGGSTNGGAGITLAYGIARDQFIRGGINRVILATDGDFNVGITDQRELVRLIEEQRESGIFLSVLGVGTGNLKDSTMEKLADKGNGNYAYLDTLHEARKVLIAEAGGTLVTVAKDVKIQVEFNPTHVASYRLIGYENRILKNEDFNNDRKDAGEIGSGHTVTALYEIVPPGVEGATVDPLKYQTVPAVPARPAADEFSRELMTVKLRYKEPDGETSRLITVPVVNRTEPLSNNLGFASAVAEFGMLLRRSDHRGNATYRDAAALARRHRGEDESGYRAEFIRLVELADALTRQTRGETSQR